MTLPRFSSRSVRHFSGWSLHAQALVVFSLLLICLGSGTLWFLTACQQADIESILAAQQMTLTGNLVDEIEHKITLQVSAVQRVAGQFTGAVLADPAQIAAQLSTRSGILGFFPTGLVVVSPAGKALGEFPNHGRMTRDYSAQPGFAEVIAKGQPLLSEPYMDANGQPMLAMLVPCSDALGQVAAVMVGEVPLNDNNFIGSIVEHRLGESGGFYLVSPFSKRILLSTDKNRILTPLPPPGVNRLLDRIVDGYEGTGITVSSRGIEEMLAARTIPSTGWKLVARLPTAEAFRAVRAMTDRLVLTFGLFGLVTVGILGLLLTRSLRPLSVAAASVREMVEGKRPLERVDIGRGAEARAMLGAFNALQDKMVTAQTAERAAHARLQVMLENMPIGVAVLSPDRQVIEINPQFQAIYGLEHHQLIGQPARVLYGDEEQYGDIGERAYPLIMAGGTFRDDVLMARKNSSVIWVRLTGHLVVGDAPDMGVIWTAEDISERHESEIRLKAQAEELARSNGDLEQFAYAASHDLRQPLRQVASYVSLLERMYGTKLDQEAHEFIAFARGGCERMDKLIVDLLDYSRIGRSGREPGPVSLAEVTTEAVQNLAAAIADCDAEIILNVPPTLPPVMGDRSELSRLMQNLAGNAIKYRAPDRRPRVEIAAHLEEGQLHLSVADNGIGIAPEYFDRIFGIFQRLHSRAEYEGTGIGLAVCKKIIEHHHGHIWVEPGSGEGVIFHLSLPVET